MRLTPSIPQNLSNACIGHGPASDQVDRSSTAGRVMQGDLSMPESFQEVAATQILQAAGKEEQKLDEAIQKLENMGEDELDQLRQKRLQKMKRRAQQRAEWQLHGHGTLSELPDQQAFFEAAKKSQRLVCHFYRPTTGYCEIVDAHMSRLAPKHMETKFCKINAEKAPYLVEKLNIFVMPTILLVKNGQVARHLRGFDELGATEKFSTDMFAYVLSSHDVLDYDGGRPDSPTGRGASKGVNSMSMSIGPRSSIRASVHETGFDSS